MSQRTAHLHWDTKWNSLYRMHLEGSLMELKTIAMTDEYAAHYFYEMGWKACRLAYKLYEEAEEAGAFRV